VPLAHQTVAPSLAHKAIGYGMAGERVDGNDAVALLAVLDRAVRLARSGSGPLLVEAYTYRMQAHTNADDATRYREDAEVAAWAVKDPLKRMREYLRTEGVLTDDVESAVAADAEDVARRLREGMGEDTAVDPQDLFRFVYTEPTPQLREQAALVADEQSRDLSGKEHGA
jgi:pyruvate dehydrogenase E1 component alpha subunit